MPGVAEELTGATDSLLTYKEIVTCALQLQMRQQSSEHIPAPEAELRYKSPQGLRVWLSGGAFAWSA